MQPETVERLTPETRDRLHEMAWMDAQLRPSLLPAVPKLPTGASPADVRTVMDIRRWREWLERSLFPEGDDG